MEKMLKCILVCISLFLCSCSTTRYAVMKRTQVGMLNIIEVCNPANHGIQCETYFVCDVKKDNEK